MFLYFGGFLFLLSPIPRPTPKRPKIRNVDGYVSYFNALPGPHKHLKEEMLGASS